MGQYRADGLFLSSGIGPDSDIAIEKIIAAWLAALALYKEFASARSAA